eukprot:scaffold6410_cov77-Skeletonema_menzelii.AAC.3
MSSVREGERGGPAPIWVPSIHPVHIKLNLNSLESRAASRRVRSNVIHVKRESHSRDPPQHTICTQVASSPPPPPAAAAEYGNVTEN